MRIFRLMVFLIAFWPVIGLGQVAATLDQWPARLQLYARDQENQCVVRIAGRVPADQVRAVSLLVRRDQQPYQYVRVSPNAVTGQFTFNPIIRPELRQFTFQLFAHRASGDSVRIAERDSIVCGDVFLIMGQSNAVGRFDNNAYRSPFCRTFGVNRGDVAYNPADTVWCLTNTSEGTNSLWGGELQRLLQQHHGVPTAVINGAAGSTTIYNHANRDPAQPASLANIYGRLLYRAQKAGVANRIKAMIWRQGEAEAANEPDAYERVYPQLYGYWKQDYPGLAKVYHGQINVLTDNRVRAGALRDFQRRTKTLYGDNEPIATVGLAGYQGLHYNEAGYRQFGLELYRLVARDFYGSTDTSNIQSPNIQRIYYGNPERNKVVLEFEPGQQMRWPADTTIINPANGTRFGQRMSDFIYTDFPIGETGIVQSATAQGNQIVMTFNKSLTAKTLTYLPAWYTDREIGYYAGPMIRNSRGMRALSFNQLPIAEPLPVAADLRAIPVDTSAIQLFWTGQASGVDQWLIERADTSKAFRLLARLPATATSFEDIRTSGRADSLRLGRVYEYRVRSVGQQAEAPYSPVVTASLQLVLTTTVGEEVNGGPAIETSSLVYPNPASGPVQVRLPLDWTGDPVELTLTSEAGAVVLNRVQRLVGGNPVLTFSVAGLPAGTYVLTLLYRTGGVRCRLVVVR